MRGVLGGGGERKILGDKGREVPDKAQRARVDRSFWALAKSEKGNPFTGLVTRTQGRGTILKGGSEHRVR